MGATHSACFRDDGEGVLDLCRERSSGEIPVPRGPAEGLHAVEPRSRLALPSVASRQPRGDKTPGSAVTPFARQVSRELNDAQRMQRLRDWQVKTIKVYGLMESLPEKEKAEWARVEDEMFQIKSKVSDCEYEEKISRKLFLDFSPDRWDLILRTGRQAERGPRPRSPPDRLASDDAAWRLDEALESYASRRAGSDKKKPVGLFGD